MGIHVGRILGEKKGKVLQKTRTSLPFMIQPAISLIPRTQYGNEACIHSNNMFAYKGKYDEIVSSNIATLSG